ncbi:MAG: AraC family transcriptional regulator ligand-binding domain-containing protein [Gammaproteobacteria bacterium]|nr:AraC family transcriptional regulator ligand-binding domain-containing protein [Gammaproteobacteria bacterium]
MAIGYYSTISGWIIPFSRAMEIFNIDTNKAFKKFDIDPNLIKDPESRVDVDKFAGLLLYCNEQSGRYDFSIQVAKKFHPGMFHALGYAMMSSSCLQDALARIVQYKRVVSNSCKLSLLEQGGQVIFEMIMMKHQSTGRAVMSLQSSETFLATVLYILRELVAFELNPIKMTISFPKPSYNTDYLNEFFKCAIEFDAEKTLVFFDLKQLNTQLLGSNTLITQVHEQMLDEFLSRIDKHDLTYVIKNKIHQSLALGAPSQAEIAQQLGMSLRNLQRKLHVQGTCYKDILEQTRHKLTLDYIVQSHLSLSEIGYLVGFSSVGNFNRAFKRWTNTTPGEYRHNHLHPK